MREVFQLATADGVLLSAVMTSPGAGFNAAAPAVVHIGDGPGLSLIAAGGTARFLADGLAALGFGNLAIETRLTERYAFSRFDESITDVKTAVDALAARGATRVVLAGSGLGAAIAVRYAGQSGDARIKGLILLAPGDDLADGLRAKVGAERYAGMVETAAKAIETGDRTFVDLGEGLIFTPPTFLDWYGPEATTALTQNLAAVEAPIVLAAGADDAASTATRLETLKGAALVSRDVTIKSYAGVGRDLARAQGQLVADVGRWLVSAGLSAPALVRTQILDVRSGDGTTLSGVLYSPVTTPPANRPAFIMVHGWAADIMRSTSHWLAVRLAQRGYPVLAVRHRESGFRGTVRGKLEDVPPDIAAWVDLMAARGYGKLIGVGHSIGNLWLSYYLATTKDTRLKALVYLAPQRDLPTHARIAMDEDLYARTVLEAEEAVRNGSGATHLIDAPFPRAIYDEDERQPMFFSAPMSGFTYYYADAFLSYWGPRSKAVHSELIKSVKVPLLALGGSRDPFMQGAWLIHITEAAGANAQYIFYDGPNGAPHSFEGYESRVTDDILAWTTKTFP